MLQYQTGALKIRFEFVSDAIATRDPSNFEGGGGCSEKEPDAQCEEQLSTAHWLESIERIGSSLSAR